MFDPPLFQETFMKASLKVLALGAFAALATLGAVNASAEKMDGSDFHPMQMNSPANPDIDAGAVAAAHPAGTESIGSSTSMPFKSTASSDDVYASAVAATHNTTSNEPIGQSTSMPMPNSGK